ECLDVSGFFERQANIIETVEKAMLAERIDFEADHAAMRAAYFLGFEIDRERCIGPALHVVHELGKIFGRDRDRQNAVLEAIIVKNIGETRRNHAAYAEIQQRP